MISKINNNPRVINIDEIMEMIPHRHPFLLIDRVKDIVSGESATGIKNVTSKEPFYPYGLKSTLQISKSELLIKT